MIACIRTAHSFLRIALGILGAHVTLIQAWLVSELGKLLSLQCHAVVIQLSIQLISLQQGLLARSTDVLMVRIEVATAVHLRANRQRHFEQHRPIVKRQCHASHTMQTIHTPSKSPKGASSTRPTFNRQRPVKRCTWQLSKASDRSKFSCTTTTS